MHLTPEEVVSEFKRRGAFDELRRELLEEFLKSEKGKEFNERLKSLLESRTDGDPSLLDKDRTEIHIILLNDFDKAREDEKIKEYILKEIIESTEYQAALVQRLGSIVTELCASEDDDTIKGKESASISTSVITDSIKPSLMEVEDIKKDNANSELDLAKARESSEDEPEEGEATEQEDNEGGISSPKRKSDIDTVLDSAPFKRRKSERLIKKSEH
ncbi:3628_t:CDS:2 [Paraglomus brasilianum]|uniref:3628_t:CDS:1 n=1 Tax=Paraglomus brasilianum TaxID=144538 RepID=A0A9N8W5Q4_9GLOM|nr:3628_t:CDS:2 [Paraglomus brasilianum]